MYKRQVFGEQNGIFRENCANPLHQPEVNTVKADNRLANRLRRRLAT